MSARRAEVIHEGLALTVEYEEGATMYPWITAAWSDEYGPAELSDGDKGMIEADLWCSQ